MLVPQNPTRDPGQTLKGVTLTALDMLTSGKSPSDEEPSQTFSEGIGDIYCCFPQRFREH